MTRIMNVNGKFTDIYSYVKNILFLMVFMTVGASGTWAQTDYSGTFFIKSVSVKQHTEGDYYVCPTEGWIYYVETNTFTETDNGQPFLTTYQCKSGGYDVRKAIWKIEKIGDYYTIQHAFDGKYMVYNGKISDANQNRIRVHLADVVTPGDNELFVIGKNKNDKIVISPKKESTNYFNVCQGNINSLAGSTFYVDKAKNDGPTKPTNHKNDIHGTIGLFNDIKQDKVDPNAPFELEVADVCETPTITYNESNGEVSISTATDGATIYYTTDGSTPTSSSTEYAAPFTVSSSANIQAIAVKDGKINSMTASKQVVKYTYNIVNCSGDIAIQYTIPYPVSPGVALSGYSSIPDDIKSPYISDEIITFKSFDGEFSEATLSAADAITETSTTENIYITYTTENLKDKFLRLQGVRTFNIKDSSSQFVYDEGDDTSLDYDSSADDIKEDKRYVWYFMGLDPYAVTVQSVNSKKYLTYTSSPEPTLGLADSPQTYIIKGSDPLNLDPEHKNATGTITLQSTDGNVVFHVTPVELPLSYTLIDKAGKRIQDNISYTGSWGLPEEWKSPLASYKYYKKATIDGDTYTFSEEDRVSGIDGIDDNVIYVTYDVKNDIDIQGGKTYLLKFLDGTSFKQENGSDGINTNATKAMYPYNNGDFNLYVYGFNEDGTDKFEQQMSSGASTRTRWLWYFVSNHNGTNLTGNAIDPYHIIVKSRQEHNYKVGTETIYNNAYLHTYKPNNDVGIITGVITQFDLVTATDPSLKPTEYMLLGRDIDHLILKTVDVIDGSQQIVDKFEQYWKNNPTVQGIAGENPSADNSTLTDMGWHRYETWAYSANWGSDAKTKTLAKGNHWFKTVGMGSGEFSVSEQLLEPQVILLDQHGWEIARVPMYVNFGKSGEAVNTAALRRFDSPMVQEYHWYPKAAKETGYHKYTVSDQAITVYDDSGKATAVKTTYNSNTLTDIPYSHSPIDNQITKVKTDFYVTYTVKTDYASSYAGAATEGAVKVSSFFLKQGGKYAQNSSNTIALVEKPVLTSTIPNDIQWKVKPNFNIDAEMGFVYGSGENSKENIEAAYYDAGKNGFDPYNVQIQSVSNTARYFKANTTSTELTNGVWTGTGSTTISLSELSGHISGNGYDQTTLDITKATFMVVDDGNGNMRLMPRFDNSVVMTSFTGLSAQLPAAPANDDGKGTQSLVMELVPTIVSSTDDILSMKGYYILSEDFELNNSLGTSSAPFEGTIDGQLFHHTFDKPLVLYAKNATIRNIILTNATISSGNTEHHLGAIACTATGDSRIYNCGILDGELNESGHVGGIVGHLDGSSHVVNCFSYATIAGGSDVGGIVGYNNYETKANDIKTMVMNCMFYGDITGGTNVSPVYGGKIINNLKGVNGLNTYNYYAYEKLKSRTIPNDKYNCALAVKDDYLNRFEFYRLLLNSNKILAAIYASTSTTTVQPSDMAKWVLETADRSIASPKPYPVLKAQGYYASIINYDVENAPDSATVGRNHGGNLGKTLTVNLSGTGITTSLLTLQRMDKDYDRFNFNYDKVQLPYFNDVGTGNYTDGNVVTGWKIISIDAVDNDPYTSANYPSSGVKDYPDHNYADRKSSNKDLYSVSGRVFSQGAYFDVPYGVTSITIEPYWAKAAYVADQYYDVVYDGGYNRENVTQLGTQVDNSTQFNGQKVYSSISSALNSLTGVTEPTVYDYAVVLVGNLHQNSIPSNGDKPFTIMSVDEDNDHEPDYSMIYHHSGRTVISPIRFDFLNIPGTAQAQKPKDTNTFLNFTIFKTKGWFETTNTCLVYSNQVEYENKDNVGTKKDAPLILLGGDFEQFVSTQSNTVDGKTTYIHVGSNVRIQSFGLGTHGDGNKSTPHIPVSVTGGEFEGFYLSGTYNQDAVVREKDNAECYISGGHFVEAAGASQEKIDGDVHWQIYDADIDAFYGGGVNAAKPITGNVTVDIFNSHVTLYCGGPKFGDMAGVSTPGNTSDDKKVTTNAIGCTFDKFFGAGFGGTSYSRKKYYDVSNPSNGNWSTWAGKYTNDKGKYYDGKTTNSKEGGDGNDQYGKKGVGVATDVDYEFFAWSGGATGGRFYVHFASFSLAMCNDVESKLKDCIINENFYGGGSYGEVKGTATSELDGCTVHGNVFGGGYSATLPTVKVRKTPAFTTNPNINKYSGMFEPGVLADYEESEYEWKQASDYSVTLTNNASGSDMTNHYLYTTVDLTALGKVGSTNLTIKGNTVVEGKIFNADGTVKEMTGGVFGGGDMSAVNHDTQVTIDGTAEGGVLNVFGGGNTADVLENTTVTITGGTIGNTSEASDTNGNVYGGGKGSETVVGGNVTVNLGTKTGESAPFNYTGTGLVKHNLYGGSALGDVNTTPNASSVYDKQTKVNIYAGTVNGSVFGGGLGSLAVAEDLEHGIEAQDAIVANNFGNTTVTIENKENSEVHVKKAVYGGANVNGILRNDATVTITGGTVGTVPDPVTNIENTVFGGGKGTPTLVNGNVTVNIGTEGQAEGGAIIYGNVYGGSALGNTSASKTGSDPIVFNVDKTTNVRLYKGIIDGNVFGGGLGQKDGDIKAYVGGDVYVLLDGAQFVNRFIGEDVDYKPVSGQIFGANNLNGTPNGHVKVHVKRTVGTDKPTDDGATPTPNLITRDQRPVVTPPAYGYDVAAVYGGGNLADYNPADATITLPAPEADDYAQKLAKKDSACAEVLIEGCDLTSIEYVYGGGNAAAVPATDVTILGSYIIDYVFGGGNGKGTGNPGANIGTYNNGATEYGSGKAITKLVGGHIRYVFGGSNTKGNVRGGTSISMPEKDPYVSKGHNCCDIRDIKEIYGAGNEAEQDGDVTLILGCVDNMDYVYGGARNAHVKGGIDLVVTSGHYNGVFGGNNLSGTIQGPITLTIEETGCKPLEIDNLYLGGNQAAYSVYGYKDDGTGKLTARTSMTDGTAVNPPAPAYSESQLYRDPILNIVSCTSIGNAFGGGLGNGAVMYGSPTVNVNMIPGDYAADIDRDGTPGKDNDKTALGAIGNVYGGGQEANVIGNATVNICTESTVTVRSKMGAPVTNEPTAVQGALITDNVFGAGKGKEDDVNSAIVTGNTTVTIAGGDVKKSVYGGGQLSQVGGNTTITISDGTIGTSGLGGATYGNIYGGGFGDDADVRFGLVKGNTNVTITGGNVLHSVYGGGAYGSVGTYTYASNAANAAISALASENTTEENTTGVAKITITGGTIGTDGHENGMVFGSSRGDIAAPDAIQDNMAWVYDTEVVIGTENDETTGPTIHGSLYGSGENGHTFHNASVKMYSGTIGNPAEFYAYRGNVYGGGCGTDKYYSTGTETHDGHGDTYNPMAGIVKGNATVEILGGSVANNIYGAGAMGKVEGSTSVTINTEGSVGVDGNHDDGNVYGAARGELGLSNEYASVTNSSVTITKGTVKGTVYGGGRAGVVTGQVTVQLNGGTILHDVYGGGALAQVNTSYHSTEHPTYTTNVNLAGTTVNGDVYGGGLGQLASAGTAAVPYADVTEYNDAKGTSLTAEEFAELSDAEKTKTPAVAAQAAVAANVNGPVKVSVTDGSATNVFGCNNLNGAPQTTVDVEIGAKSGGGALSGSATVSGSVYGGGNMAAYTGSPAVKIYGGTVNTNVYGGGLGATAVTGGTSVTMEGGTVGNDVYGGGSQANVTGSVAVSIAGGTVTHDVYGGGALANTNTANWNGDGSVQYVALTVKAYPTAEELAAGVLKTDVTPVAGYFTEAAGVYTRITNPDAKANGSTVYYKKAVTGTWADGKTSASNTTTVSLTGGLIGNAYGGGLGNSTTMANVYGDVTVTVNNGVTDPAKGIVFNQQIEHPVIGGTDYPTPVMGRVFGCNNYNGTPTGEVTVHVYSTRQIRKDTEGEILPGHGSSDRKFSYDIQSVYGGGNQADYLPATGKKSHVIIDGCDETSIEKVYGGCNSAVIPETDVLINGCYDIGYGFGGGNGGRPIKKEDGNWYENEGAIVIGTARIECQGGKIGQVFGGGDSKGSCGNTAPVIPAQGTGTCPLWITRLYGAGNEGDVTHVNIVLAACSGNAIEYVHGGSYNAHVHGDITLTITSGILKNVYGGNDSEGGIEGDITVNIEETDGCNPIIIQNLVGGGNEAAYPGTLKPGGVETPINRHGKITVNVKSATRIDNIYGGSFNAEADADTEININMMKGNKAGETVDIPKEFSYIPNITKLKDNDDGKTIQCQIANDIGTIGNVFGGGKQGIVKGNTQVNINSAAKVYIMKRNGSGQVLDTNGNPITTASGQNIPAGITIDCTDEHDTKGAHITGNVFGGGENANVIGSERAANTGNTFVNICANPDTYEAIAEGSAKVTISNGSVYGGGSAGDVYGNTHVTMAGGYVYDGVYGGGLMGSVGTFTRTTDVTTESNEFDHSTHTATCLGKPTACTAGGTCTVVISGGQVGPKEAAMTTGGMLNTGNLPGYNGGPVDVGFVFGAGRGVVEDPDVDKDADFHTYVNETYVTINGGLIMASVYGGGENGRVLGDTHVTISGGQIGCGEGSIIDDKPVPYDDAQFVDPTTTAVTEDNKLAGCASWTFNKNDYKSYDPLANLKYSDGSTVNDAKIKATDGNTYYGSVFGGGSGYYPYAKANGTHDWLRSAGAVYGNTNITITGGHILTGVYGGNEVTDVGTYTNNDKGYPIVRVSGGKCTINMSGGTVGVPRTLAQIEDLPVSCSLFGAGKGDHRTHFNTWTNIHEAEINISGGIIYGSVFGGGEEGHVLRNVTMNISGSAKIGTHGTSGMDGNVFGGGRGYSGVALTAGSTGGNVTMNITGGNMLGSVYGGGRLASVGIGFTPPNDIYYGQLIDDTDENENGSIDESEKYGHIAINISGGKIGKATVDETASHPVGGNVYGGSMGRITYLNDNRNPLWPKQAVVKLSEITISGGEIMNSVYGGGEIGIVRNRATVNVESGTIHGNVFGGGYGSDDQDPTTISAGGYNDIPSIHYTFTPMIWTGCVSGDTYVNISGGQINKSVYGGGNFASVGLMNYNSSADGKTYNYIKKHDITNGFGLSWPYEFQYIQAAPTDDAPGGKVIGGKTNVTITGGRIGTTAETDNAGFVYGGSKGQVFFTKADNVTPITDIDEQVYAEAFSANVRETEVNINYGSTPESDDGSTTAYIVRSVYGGGEDGHVMENAVVNLNGGWIGHTLFGGGKGASTYNATLLDPSTDSPKGSTEAVHSWTAGKVYGNTIVTVNGGKVGWFVYGGGNMASVGKGNYSGGADDYSTAGYGETLTGNLWTSETEGDYAWHFLNSGKTTVNLLGGQVGTATVGFEPKDQIPYGSVFGGSRGTAAMDVGNKSPRYKYVPDFYLGYVNKTVVNVGGTTETGAVTGDGPTVYGSVYGGGQDGHVRNSTEVRIFKGNISGQTSDAAGRSGHVFGAGSGIGTYREDGKDKCSSSSGSVTCTALVEMNGGSIHGNIWGGGAMASVGPPRTGQPKNEQRAASDSHKSFSFTRVDVKGGSVGGSVYGASRGPSDAFLTQRFANYSLKYDKTKYATDIWSDVSVTGGTIGDNVYGGGQGGIVKESTTVSLTGGNIAHDAYGGGQGTDSIAADIYGNTTIELNKDKTVNDNGCIVERVFGCNDLNGTPKGHVLVHIYATQHRDSTQIGQKSAKFKTMEGGYTIENYTADSYDDDLKSIAKKVLTPAEITTFETAISGAANDSLKRVALDRYIEAIADKKYDVLGVYGGGDLALYEPTDHSETTDVIIDGCDLTSIKQVYGGGNAASTPATHVRINAAYEIHEAFGGGNGKDAYYRSEKWYENPGANVGYYATFHHDTSDAGKGSSQGNPYPAVANADADTPEERHANTSYHYGTGTTTLEITGGRIHTTYGGSNTRGNVRAEAHTSTEDAGVCAMSIDASYPAGKTADTDATSKVEAKCVEYQDAIYGGSYGANVYSDVVIDITNGTYGKIFGGNDREGHIYGSITINVHEEGCKPIVIGRLYAGGNEADYSIYGFKDNGSARSKAEYDALSEVEKANITVRRDPQINIISATRIDTIYGGGNQAKLIGSPSINVNMKNGFVAANYVKKKPADFTIERHEATDHGKDCSYTVIREDDGKAILAIGSIGNIYGGGFKGDVQGNTRVEIGTGEWLSFTGKRETTDADGKVYTYNSETGKWDWTKTVDETTTTGTVNAKPAPARNAATITGNVFGGGEGEAPESGERAFFCESAMVGVDGDGVAHPDGGTTVVIANGTVGTLDAGNLVAGTGNVYGGGELGRVEKNTVVTIGAIPEEGETSANTKFKPTIHGTVFGAGKGVATHGYSALVRGNSTVTIQGFAKVERSVYGGGEKASIGRYHVAKDAADAAAHGVEVGMPYSLLSDNSGSCTVIVKDSAEVGPNDMLMTRAGGPDDSGYIFGGGKGVTAYEGITGDAKPWRMTIDAIGNSTKEVYNSVTSADTLLYLKYVESLGLATQTDVTVGGAAFIKGSVYGGAENGYVQHDTKVTIQDNCQIGNGYVQRNEAGDMLPEANRYSLNRRYTPTEWAEGHLYQDGESNYTSSLPECASWPYGQTIEYGGNYYTIYAPHDIFAVAGTELYPGGATTYGGRQEASDGHTFYGNVFGGGSGYYPYATGKWHFAAGSVGGNTTVNITGGHILTNVYGGNEMTNVNGSATINFGGTATLGVPRTLGQIDKHPVTCYLFGAGKGDTRVFFNKQTNIKDAIVNITGGTIYGSVFGGGEDGHVLGNVNMDISDGQIGTWGTSYVDGNVFGGGRGFTGDAYTAGNVAGSVTMNISGGTMLGSIYGGGRLASVGYGLYLMNETGYGEMRDDDKMDNGDTAPEGMFPKGRGHVEINISGGTIGNNNEYKNVTADGAYADLVAAKAALATWQSENNVPKTTYETIDNGDGTYTNRLLHTKGGNVYAGGMGRREELSGAINHYAGIHWYNLGNVKSTKVTITGGHIKSNVYGGGEYGAVRGNHLVDGEALSTEINITGGTVGTEIVDAEDSVMYTFGSVFGGGTGTTADVTPVMPIAHADSLAAFITDSTKVTVTGEAMVKASVYGGGEVCAVGGSTHVNISGNAQIGRNEVWPKDDPKKPGYVKFGSWRMGNVYGGGRGSEDAVIAGVVKGNTNVNISGGNIYHNVYGGGALGSVGTFFVSGAADGGTPQGFVPRGVPYWTMGPGGATGPEGITNKGIAYVTITGGTIGISGRDNGLVFGSSRGDISAPTGTPLMDIYDRVAWVRATVVNIGTKGTAVDSPDYLTKPLIKGSVYGGGENGHNYQNANVNVYSGTIGIADNIPGTETIDPWWDFENDSLNREYRAYRGNVYGAGSGSDTYIKDGRAYYNPRAGMIGGSTVVNIAGGHIGRSVYGAGAMASVGNISNANDTIQGGSAKHSSETSSFALSWPYKYQFAPNTGKATVNVTGGHIGTDQVDGGDVYGSARGVAGDRYETAHLAYVKEAVVNVNYPETIDMPSETAIQNDFTTQCITGSVHGSGENGFVYDDTQVTLNEGLIGHSLYGGGKGNGTYTMKLSKIGGGTYDAKIYSLIAGKVFGNTYVTMNGGRVGRNVYGGGNMGSVGKGNYASGTDDYAHESTIGAAEGYGEKIDSALWTATPAANSDAWYFQNSGKATVNVISGIVGYIDATNPEVSMKNQLPYGNVIGGSAGEAAPNIDQTPRYLYSPAFFSGYVNETDVTIGGYQCKTAYGDYKVDDYITAKQFESVAVADTAKWKIVGPTIFASVYGGSQDGHVRRDTKVTVLGGEIGKPYNDTNISLLKTDNLDSPQWLHRGNIYGGGSGITKYRYDFNHDGDTEDANEQDYSNSSGSVTRFTEVNILGGTIHRNVYGGGSMGSVGAPDMGQGYAPYQKGDTEHGVGYQSQNTVNIGGGKGIAIIGTPTGYNKTYGGDVFGACRGMSSLDPTQFANSVWTKVIIKNGATIMGNVFGGGDNGMVKKDSEVIIGE